MLILTDHELINTDDVSAIYFTERRSATIPGRLIARMKDGKEYTMKIIHNKNFNIYVYLRDIAAAQNEGLAVYNISEMELP